MGTYSFVSFKVKFSKPPIINEEQYNILKSDITLFSNYIEPIYYSEFSRFCKKILKIYSIGISISLGLYWLVTLLDKSNADLGGFLNLIIGIVIIFPSLLIPFALFLGLITTIIPSLISFGKYFLARKTYYTKLKERIIKSDSYSSLLKYYL